MLFLEQEKLLLAENTILNDIEIPLIEVIKNIEIT
jgi:hypothetical protein